MKKYIKPEIDIIFLETEDIMSVSGEGVGADFQFLKTTVGGREGTDYGSQDISVFND